MEEENSEEEGYLISESQITLLKFLDGHLVTVSPHLFPTEPAYPPWITTFFVDLFSLYERDLNEARPKESKDAITWTGLILVTEGLIVLGLGSKEGREGIMEVLERVVGESRHSYSPSE